MLPFVVCNSLQALPHPTSFGVGVVRFDLGPVLTLCLFDSSFEGIVGFLISVSLSVSVCMLRHCWDDVTDAFIDDAIGRIPEHIAACMLSLACPHYISVAKATGSRSSISIC